MISCNLAASFARHGKRVLLVDCDMRRPMLHRHFRLTNELGLIAWFEAGAKIPDDPLADAALLTAQLDALMPPASKYTATRETPTRDARRADDAG